MPSELTTVSGSPGPPDRDFAVLALNGNLSVDLALAFEDTEDDCLAADAAFVPTLGELQWVSKLASFCRWRNP